MAGRSKIQRQLCPVSEFIGIDLDSIKMTLSIDPEKAESVLFKFNRAAQMFDDGSLTASLVRSLAGNCMWFSSVVLTGRICTHPLLRLTRLLEVQGSSPEVRRQIFVKAYSSWQKTLVCWSAGSVINANVKIISSQLVSDSVVIQQDAGDEGLGYFWVSVKDDFKRLRFAACTLPKEDSPSSSTYKARVVDISLGPFSSYRMG